MNLTQSHQGIKDWLIMAVSLKTIYKWVCEEALKEPESYAEYFFEDIASYIFLGFRDNSDCLNPDLPLSGHVQKLFACTSQDEVREWMRTAGDQVGSMLEIECAVENFFCRMCPKIMHPNERVSIILTRNEWGQIIDGLTCRAADYEATAQYYETGHADRTIQEVKDAKEARNLAEWYRDLTAKIERQIEIID
jgi:hypothetical protein